MLMRYPFLSVAACVFGGSGSCRAWPCWFTGSVSARALRGGGWGRSVSVVVSMAVMMVVSSVHGSGSEKALLGVGMRAGVGSNARTGENGENGAGAGWVGWAGGAAGVVRVVRVAEVTGTDGAVWVVRDAEVVGAAGIAKRAARAAAVTETDGATGAGAGAGGGCDGMGVKEGTLVNPGAIENDDIGLSDGTGTDCSELFVVVSIAEL